MRPWGGHENFRVVRYIHTNWYGKRSTRWIVEETISQNNDWAGWYVQYELANFKDKERAIRYCQRLSDAKAAADLEEKKRAVEITEDIAWQSKGRKP